MRKILTILTCTFILITIFNLNTKAQEIEWLSIEKAVTLNNDQPRKFMIYVYSDNCGWCRRMASGTFSNPVITKYINNNFYAVKLNASIKKDVTIGSKTFTYKPADPVNNVPAHHELVALLLQGRMAYPSVAFMDEELTYLGLQRGYKSPQNFEPWLHFVAGDVYKENNNITEYIETFEGEL